MKFEEIISELSVYSKKFPEQALLEAVKQKEEVTEVLLKHFDKINKGKIHIESEDMLHMFGMFLLAEFREQRAFPLFVEFCKRKELDDWIGDVITESLKNILYSTYNGDEALLKSLIEWEEADLFARLAALDVFCINMMNEKQEQKICDYIDGLMRDCLERERLGEKVDEQYTSFLAGMVAEYKLKPLLPLVQEFYDVGIMDETIYGKYDGFIDCLYRKGIRNAGFSKTTIEELRGWACFEQENKKTSNMDLDKLVERMSREKNKKLGRNDPCHCGSGKKYKKCCLRKDEEAIRDPLIRDRVKGLEWYPVSSKEGRGETEGVVYIDVDFDEEYIEIDKLVYLALAHRAIPMWEKQEGKDEMKIRKLYYLEQAYLLLKEKMKKEGHKNFKEYDKHGKIHYRSGEWMSIYVQLMEERRMQTDEVRRFIDAMQSL